jgi:hypothetical protein
MALPPHCRICWGDPAGEVRFADYNGPGGPSLGGESYSYDGVYYFCSWHIWPARLLSRLKSRWAIRFIPTLY